MVQRGLRGHVAHQPQDVRRRSHFAADLGLDLAQE
eukprot:CAMPEP_0179125262 /NCGR_PEP_ID=MMETSP0796-20121207/59232_1 /TAXON_ID=73915 /ORGANISM="Pyrodinium bahamense, Strain pbaha01" /LENGTH=34 /DNA_ID= /DNA_START= /DNA_END= /DNA_ORIENTATION=